MRVTAGGHIYISNATLGIVDPSASYFIWSGADLEPVANVNTTTDTTNDTDNQAFNRKLLKRTVDYAIFDHPPWYPFNLVGRVYKGVDIVATGALVAPNLVLTNAHVCLDRQNGWSVLNANKVRFAPGFYIAAPVGGGPSIPKYPYGRLQAQFLDFNPWFHPSILPSFADHDLCLISLRTPFEWPSDWPVSIPKEFFGIGANCKVNVHHWMSAGNPARYLAIRNGSEILPKPNQFEQYDNDVLLHFTKLNGYCQATDVCPKKSGELVSYDDTNPYYCPAYNGQSGSPMWVQDLASKRRFIECVASSESMWNEDENRCVPLTGDDLAWLVHAIPRATGVAVAPSSNCMKATTRLLVYAHKCTSLFNVAAKPVTAVESGERFLPLDNNDPYSRTRVFCDSVQSKWCWARIYYYEGQKASVGYIVVGSVQSVSDACTGALITMNGVMEQC